MCPAVKYRQALSVLLSQLNHSKRHSTDGFKLNKINPVLKKVKVFFSFRLGKKISVSAESNQESQSDRDRYVILYPLAYTHTLLHITALALHFSCPSIRPTELLYAS